MSTWKHRTFIRQQRGQGLIFVVGLFGLIGMMTGVMRNMNQQEMKALKAQEKTTRSRTKLSTYLSRAEVLFNSASSTCGQIDGYCPGVYVDPVTCDPAKVGFAQISEGPGWYFSSYSADGYFVGDQSEAIEKMKDKKKLLLELSGPVEVHTANLGEIEFEIPKTKSMSPAYFIGAEEFESSDSSFSERMIASIEGVECLDEEAVDAVYLTAKHYIDDKVISEQTMRVPVYNPGPECILTAGTNHIDLDQTSIDVSMIVNGAWKEVALPDGDSFQNPYSLSVQTADLVFDGSVEWEPRDRCDTSESIEAEVYGIRGYSSSCSVTLDYDIDVLDLPDDCPEKIDYLRWQAQWARMIAQRVPDDSSDDDDDEEEEVFQPITCPEPYRVQRGGKWYVKTYFVNNKYECVAILGRDMTN